MEAAAEEITINDAAGLVHRSPETVRRWVWSGRLRARKSGRNLMVPRRDVEVLAAEHGSPKTLTLQEWGDLAQRVLKRPLRGGRSASELVLEERRRRSEWPDARR